jgi:hypothetical protein
MESFDAKIARAEEHLNLIQVEIGQFLKVTEHKTHLKTNPANNTAWIVYYVVDPNPPIRIGTMVGDCVHNMRSALDNLICGLIRVNDTSHDCVNRQFPIATTLPQWDNRRVEHTKGVTEAALAVIKSFQPCFGPDELGVSHPLAILQRLNNIDKHRTALVTTGYDTNVRFAIHTTDGVRVATYPEPIYGGPVSIPIDFDTSTIPKEVKVEIQGTSRVILRDLTETGLKELSVTAVLRQLLQFFKDIFIPRFKPFFL